MTKRERPPLLFNVRYPIGFGGQVCLLAADEATEQSLSRFDGYDTIQADNLRKPRSLPRHRFYWKALSEIVAATECASDAERLHLAIKLGTGYCLPVKLSTGALVWVPDSTSFESMDDAQFATFMQHADKWIAENIGTSLNEIMTPEGYQ